MTIKIFRRRIGNCSHCPNCVPYFRDEMECAIAENDLEPKHLTDCVPEWCPLPDEVE